MKVSDIKINERKRSKHNIGSIKESIKTLGLINPIAVRPDGTLVAGYHRLKACQALGFDEVAVNVIEGDNLKAELAEIDENLVRNELSSLERADHLARRKRIYEEMHPEAAKLSGGRKPRNGDTVSSFSEDTAKRMGVSQRTVQRDVRISEALVPSVREMVRGTVLEDSRKELGALSRLEPIDQERAARKILDGDAHSVEEALKPPSLAYYGVVYGDASDIETDAPLPTASKDAVLFLWASPSALPEAMSVMRRWGLDYRDHAVVAAEPTEGVWFKARHKLLLVGTKGDVDVPPSVVLKESLPCVPENEDAWAQNLIEIYLPGNKRLDLTGRIRGVGWVHTHTNESNSG